MVRRKGYIRKTDDFWGDNRFWAPELHKYCDKYFLFASFCGECTQILVSDAPDGKFVPYADPPTDKDWQCIDGTLYLDKSGKPYIVLSHSRDVYRDEKWYIRETDIEAIQLTQDLKKPVGKPFPLLCGSNFKKSISRLGNNQIWHITEGPFMYRSNENLYMLWSGFNKECNGIYNYFQAVARSDNGEIDRKWIFQDELLYENDGGHGMVFRDFDNRLMLVVHQPNNGGGSESPLSLEVEEVDGKLLLKNR